MAAASDAGASGGAIASRPADASILVAAASGGAGCMSGAMGVISKGAGSGAGALAVGHAASEDRKFGEGGAGSTLAGGAGGRSERRCRW